MSTKTSSEIWQFFELVSPDTARCILCDSLYSRKGRSTSALRNHLNCKHPDEYFAMRKLEGEKKQISKRYLQNFPEENASSNCDDQYQWPTPASRKKLKTRNENEHQDSLSATVDTNSGILEELNAWCEELINLPHDQQILARREINEVLFRARLGVLEKEAVRDIEEEAEQSGTSTDETKNEIQLESPMDPLDGFGEGCEPLHRPPLPPPPIPKDEDNKSAASSPPDTAAGPSLSQAPLYYLGKYITSVMEGLPKKRSVKLQEQILHLILKEQTMALED